MHAFQRLLDSVARTQDGRYEVTIDASWAQGRTAFGGLSAALILQAMLADIEPSRRLRVLSVSFVGPVPVAPVSIDLRRLRDGGSVTHMQGDLWADGQVVVTLTATFAKDRPATRRVAPPKMPNIPGPDGLDAFPYIEGVTPEFTRHFEMRMARGHCRSRMPTTPIRRCGSGFASRCRCHCRCLWPSGMCRRSRDSTW